MLKLGFGCRSDGLRRMGACCAGCVALDQDQDFVGLVASGSIC